MYVSTFYSFKGGVGRSMALANVAVDLVRRGRRVLAVDFDLEAPGLDTFDVLRPSEEVPGIIEFVQDYMDSDQAPDARDFVRKLPAIDNSGGELWIMPSGAQHTRYGAQFNEIDWAGLYEKRDGYLLFEDLKAQWEQTIKPDYVLIDSRTGHTDTSGICTRQLPNAVTIFFFPNEQNLRGLRTVVSDIRAESDTPHKKEIDLHFVMSNVPDLDDEDRILREKIDAFREQLGFEGAPLIVHRYDSLSLLNQVVFTKDRPRSRLAREYGRLAREIVGRNLDDRDGALDYVRRSGERWRRRGTVVESPEVMNAKLDRIERVHVADGDVLFALGAFFDNDGQHERAVSLFNRAIDAGCDEPDAYLKRARVRASGDPTGVTEDALHVLQNDGLPPPLIREASRLVSEERAGDVARSVAVKSLDTDGRFWLAGVLAGSRKERKVSIDILEPVAGDENLSIEKRAVARSMLALCHLGLGDCAAASRLLVGEGREVDSMVIQDAFNYGMAVWGETGEVHPRPFLRVVELHEAGTERNDANYFQCLAVAQWATGENAKALDSVARARKALHEETRGDLFSCWRYYDVAAKVFATDLDDIEALIRGEADRKPRFISAPETGAN